MPLCLTALGPFMRVMALITIYLIFCILLTVGYIQSIDAPSLDDLEGPLATPTQDATSRYN